MAKSKKTKSKKPSKPKVDLGGTARSFPGPHGPMISKNPDLGSGPYSQNNGKPYGGKPAGEFIAEQRRKTRRKAKEYGKVVAELAEQYLKVAQELYDGQKEKS